MIQLAQTIPGTEMETILIVGGSIVFGLLAGISGLILSIMKKYVFAYTLAVLASGSVFVVILLLLHGHAFNVKGTLAAIAREWLTMLVITMPLVLSIATACVCVFRKSGRHERRQNS